MQMGIFCESGISFCRRMRKQLGFILLAFKLGGNVFIKVILHVKGTLGNAQRSSRVAEEVCVQIIIIYSVIIPVIIAERERCSGR